MALWRGADGFRDEFEAVVAEEHLIANEHGWRSENPAAGRRLGRGVKFRAMSSVFARSMSPGASNPALFSTPIRTDRCDRSACSAQIRVEDRAHVFGAAAVLDCDERALTQFAEVE